MPLAFYDGRLEGWSKQGVALLCPPGGGDGVWDPRPARGARRRPRSPAGGTQRAVLAVLLLHVNQVVSGKRLVDEFWGDEPPKAAEASLRVFVSELRKALEPGRPQRSAGWFLLTRPRSPFGASQRSPTLPTSRSRRRRSHASKSFASLHSSSASRQTSRSDAARSSSASSKQWSPSIRYASACAASSCWRSTARAARPRRSRRTGRRAACSSRSSGSSQSPALQELERAILRQDSALELATAVRSAQPDGQRLSLAPAEGSKRWTLAASTLTFTV